LLFGYSCREWLSCSNLNRCAYYAAQEVWAYATGEPSPTQALAGRPLGAELSPQELLDREEEEQQQALDRLGLPGRTTEQMQRTTSKPGRPGTLIPPPVHPLEGA